MGRNTKQSTTAAKTTAGPSANWQLMPCSWRFEGITCQFALKAQWNYALALMAAARTSRPSSSSSSLITSGGSRRMTLP